MIVDGLDLEPGLPELLADEVMQLAVRSSGTTPGEFMEQWRDLAVRLQRPRARSLPMSRFPATGISIPTTPNRAVGWMTRSELGGEP